MKKIILPIVFIFSIILINNCKSDKGTEICNCDNKGTSIIFDTQLHSKWIFESFEMLSGHKEIPSANLKEMNVEFSDSSLILVNGQNNFCDGNYQIFINNCINIGQLRCTYVGGTDEQMLWEDKYWDALNNSNCYKVSGNHLIIYYRDIHGFKIMNFKKQ